MYVMSACARCVLPSPTLLYMSSGLKDILPGLLAIACVAACAS